VLAHRDPKDWFVFEAASWAIAEHSMPEERVRQLWSEPLPAVELAARLRQLSVFAGVSADELFRLASTGRQVRYEPGHVLSTEGQSPENLLFLLEGTVDAKTRAGLARVLEPVAPLGFEEVITAAPALWSLRTLTRAVCLDMTVEECRTLLADNADLVQGLFKTLLEHSSFTGDRLVLEGGPESADALGRLTADGLTPIEKVLALQHVGPFAQVPADELVHLSNVARRVPFKSGQVLARAVEVPSVFIVVSGELVLEGSDDVVRAKAGDVAGLMETLGGVALGCDVKAAADGLVLRIGHEELFEVLSERPAFLRRLFASLFGRRDEAVAVEG
jgi:CRP-like cAMP-binding protein